jgi:hypothetical protein
VLRELCTHRRSPSASVRPHSPGPRASASTGGGWGRRWLFDFSMRLSAVPRTTRAAGIEVCADVVIACPNAARAAARNDRHRTRCRRLSRAPETADIGLPKRVSRPSSAPKCPLKTLRLGESWESCGCADAASRHGRRCGPHRLTRLQCPRSSFTLFGLSSPPKVIATVARARGGVSKPPRCVEEEPPARSLPSEENDRVSTLITARAVRGVQSHRPFLGGYGDLSDFDDALDSSRHLPAHRGRSRPLPGRPHHQGLGRPSSARPERPKAPSPSPHLRRSADACRGLPELPRADLSRRRRVLAAPAVRAVSSVWWRPCLAPFSTPPVWRFNPARGFPCGLAGLRFRSPVGVVFGLRNEHDQPTEGDPT